MVSNRTLILECGSRRAALGIFSRAGQRLLLHQLAVENFPPETNPGEGEWLENTRAAFRALRARTKIRGPVVVVMPAHLSLTKFIKIPRVEIAQREKILRFEAAQNIPYALTDVVWGSVVVNELPADLEILLATAKLEILDPLCAAAQEAGFEPRVVLPSVFATLAGFKLVSGNAGRNFMGLNLGARSTTLVLVESGRFALRTFALGLGEGTEDTPGDKNELVGAKLLQEITRSLLHFQWRSGMGKPAQVYLSGIGANRPGLAEVVREKLKVPVEVCDPLGAVDFADELVAKSATTHALTLLNLVGAAVTQFAPVQPAVNLRPPRVVERANHQARRPWLVAAALLAGMIWIPPLIHFRNLRDEAVKKSLAIERELAPVRARDLRNRANLQRLAEFKQRIVALEGVRERRSTWLRLLAGLQDRLTQVEDVWLEELQLAPPASNTPLKLFVSGRMLDRAHPLAKVSPETYVRVKTLLARLSDCPFVTTVDSGRFDNQQPGILKFDFVLVADAQRPL